MKCFKEGLKVLIRNVSYNFLFLVSSWKQLLINLKLSYSGVGCSFSIVVFENMIIFISSTMIYHLFRDVFCCFADIVIIKTFFGTFTMANQIKFMRKLCFIFNIKRGTLPWKATSLLILSGNRVFNLFFIDLIIKPTFWP